MILMGNAGGTIADAALPALIGQQMLKKSSVRSVDQLSHLSIIITVNFLIGKNLQGVFFLNKWTAPFYV